MQAQVSSTANTWAAELRIDAGMLGGWDHLSRMMLVHIYNNGLTGGAYSWPYQATGNKPDTWTVTALGSLPQINSLDPISTTVGIPDFTLEVNGENFLDGATV